MNRLILELAEEGRYLSVSKGLYVISDRNGEVGRVACEDVDAVLLTAHNATITKQALARMAEQGTVGVVCGSNFMPSALVLPISHHFQSCKILHLQVSVSKPLCKRIWQNLIISKISNQTRALRMFHPESSSVAKLEAARRKVQSGDSGNMEGYAARLYWSGLMGNDFRRDPDKGGFNPLLNYGYAILRSMVARAVCAAGLNPSLGVHHHNQYNPFCLVDDLMEPLRPAVDIQVMRTIPKTDNLPEELSPRLKRSIGEVRFARLNYHGKCDLAGAAQRMAQDLVNSFEERKNLIGTPTFT